MINSIIRYSLSFILLILLQVLLLDNIQVSGYINPYVYVMFILILPFDIPSWLLLLLSFATGFLMDLFSGSPGMHSAATVLAGFIRPHILNIISTRDGYEPHSSPSLSVYGFRWFLIYTTLIVLVHHTALFYLEVFRFADFFRTMLRVLVSSVFTISFILLIEFNRRGK
ncbi:MAG: rod shape-determining protein MreD [Bacteroidales bacterium]|nr:rod shape-determining protein MreD [Bacteroidales bacterium]